MKKRNALISSLLILALSAMTLVATPVAASPAGGDTKHGRFGDHSAAMSGFGSSDNMRSMLRMMDRLDLSKEQRDKVWDIMDAERPNKRHQLQALMEGRKELRQLIEKGDYDDNQVRNLAETQGKAMAELIILKTRTQSQIRALLTADQQTKLTDLRKEHRDGSKKHRRGVQ